jgi:hypothetical protein
MKYFPKIKTISDCHYPRKCIFCGPISTNNSTNNIFTHQRWAPRKFVVLNYNCGFKNWKVQEMESDFSNFQTSDLMRFDYRQKRLPILSKNTCF